MSQYISNKLKTVKKMQFFGVFFQVSMEAYSLVPPRKSLGTALLRAEVLDLLLLRGPCLPYLGPGMWPLHHAQRQR